MLGDGLITEAKGRPWDRMAFGYTNDYEADDKGIPRTVMRPRIPIRISNVRSAGRGGSDSGYWAEALADSGADIRSSPERRPTGSA